MSGKTDLGAVNHPPGEKLTDKTAKTGKKSVLFEKGAKITF